MLRHKYRRLGAELRDPPKWPSLPVCLKDGATRWRGHQQSVNPAITKGNKNRWGSIRHLLPLGHYGLAWISHSPGFVPEHQPQLESKDAMGEAVGTSATEATEPGGYALPSFHVSPYLTLQTLEDVPRTLQLIEAAQEAAALRISQSFTGQLRPSELRAAVKDLRRLQGKRGQILRSAVRLQRLRSCAGLTKASRQIGGNTFAEITGRCGLTPTVASSLRATADRIATGAGLIPTRQLLLLCDGLAQLGCCSPSLAAAALQRILVQASQLDACNVALGVQVAAVLLKHPASYMHFDGTKSASDQPHEGIAPHGVHGQLEAAETTPIGRRRRSASPRPAAAVLPEGVRRRFAAACTEEPQDRELEVPAVRDDGAVERLGLLVATRLLSALGGNEALRKRLPIRICVRTAEACAQLAKQRSNKQEPLAHSPAAFSGAVTLPYYAATSLSLLQSCGMTGELEDFGTGQGRGGMPAPGMLPRDAPLATARHSAIDDRRPSYASPAGALQIPPSSAVAITDSGAAGKVAAAALRRRIQQSLAPSVVALLLSEAAARQHRGGAEPYGDDQDPQGWSGELLGVAMKAAATGVQVQSTRKKLLLQLLRHLQRHSSNLPQPTEQFQQGMARDDRFITSQTFPVGTTPVLASVCHSLASAGLSIRKPGLTFLIDAIRASLPAHILTETATSWGPAIRSERSPGGRSSGCDGDPADAVGAFAPSRLADCISMDIQHAASSLPADASNASEIAAFYGEWCVILWAGAKLLKAAAGSLPPDDPVILATQRLLVKQLLAELIARLPVAEPPDVAQIAEALRLLLLIDMKMETSPYVIAPGCFDPRRPLILRQRLLPAHELLSTLQALARHFMQHTDRFGALEIIGFLRLFAQLDLLHYLDLEWVSGSDAQDGAIEARKQCARQQHALSLPRESEATPAVSGAGVLRHALARICRLNNEQRLKMGRAESPHQHQQGLWDAPLHRAMPSLDVYAQSLLRSLALKYPEELQRLPQAVRRGLLKQAGSFQIPTHELRKLNCI